MTPVPLIEAADVSKRFAGGLGRALNSAVTFPIGIDVEGAPVVADFADPNTCHALVAGSTGSGKSELLQTLVASFAVDYPPSRVAFLLIDYKGGAAFKDLMTLPHVVARTWPPSVQTRLTFCASALPVFAIVAV